MLYDTHAHLDMIDNLDEVIQNAKESNVKVIVAQSVNLESIKKNLEICNKYPEIVRLSVGLYPEETLKESDFEELRKIVNQNKDSTYAIGESGMDFSSEKPSRELQEKIFRRQLDLAQNLDIPISIHTRKAEKEIVEILKEYPKAKKILHCFSGKFKLVREAIEIGCYFSIPTNITRAEHFQKMVKEVPKDKILTETDTPYLSPFKEIQNEPRNVKETVKIISKVWQISIEEVEDIIENNFKTLYPE